MWIIQQEQLLNMGHGGTCVALFLERAFSALLYVALFLVFATCQCLDTTPVNQDPTVLSTKLHPLPDHRSKRTSIHKPGMLCLRLDRPVVWASYPLAQSSPALSRAMNHSPCWSVTYSAGDLSLVKYSACWVLALLSLLTLVILERKARLAFWF